MEWRLVEIVILGTTRLGQLKGAPTEGAGYREAENTALSQTHHLVQKAHVCMPQRELYTIRKERTTRYEMGKDPGMCIMRENLNYVM